jgi:hypothetical protein
LRFIRLASFVVVVGICKLTEAYYTNPLGKFFSIFKNCVILLCTIKWIVESAPL